MKRCHAALCDVVLLVVLLVEFSFCNGWACIYARFLPGFGFGSIEGDLSAQGFG